MVARDDDYLLELTAPLHDGLYEYSRRSHLHEADVT
jgi:hypothetical protein